MSGRVYLNNQALKEGEDYEWVDSAHIKVNVEIPYSWSVVAVYRPGWKRGTYIDTGRQAAGYVATL